MKILENAGLSPQESSLYVSLVGQSECSASELAKKHRLPRSTIRSQLDRLVEKQIILSRYEKHTQYYRAAAPEALISFAEAELYSQTDRVRVLRESLPTFIQALGTPSVASQSFLGTASVATELRRLLATTEAYVCVVDHDAVAQQLGSDDFLALAPSALCRVLVRRGMSLPVQWLCDRRFLSAELQLGAMCFVIGHSVLLLQPAPGEHQISLLVLEQPTVARVLTVLFDSLWRTSSSVA